MIVWQALWERLLSISDSLAQHSGEEHATEALKPLVDFWMHTVQPQPDTLLSINHAEHGAGGEKFDHPDSCKFQSQCFRVICTMRTYLS